MCNYGLENVNWGLLACLLIYLFVAWVYTLSDDECDECDICEESAEPAQSYGCPKPEAKKDLSQFSKLLFNLNKVDPKLTCPANPINLTTACGISRYY
jgi:hypothetical protein